MTALAAAAALVIGLLAWHGLTSRPEGAPSVAYAGHQYDAPVHLARNTSYVRSDILSSGDVEVSHWIRTSRAVTAVSLSAPHVPGLHPGRIHLTHVVLAADGLIASTTQHVPFGVTNTFRVPATHRLLIRYRLHGVLQHDGGSDERALARVTALDVSTASKLMSTTRSVVGATVLSLACTPQGATVAVPCGSEHNGTWIATLGPSQQGSQVMAQVDLS